MKVYRDVLDKVISEGFLYTLWNGQLKIREGIVVESRRCSKREAIFRHGSRYCDWTRCSPEPRALVHAHLWLPERDDALARELLIEYYTENIKRLEKQIEGYQANIKILQDA